VGYLLLFDRFGVWVAFELGVIVLLELTAFLFGGLFQLTMHPHVIGYRSRIWIIEELIRLAQSRPGVWFATHADVARWAKDNAG
jgi:hypothetical protein